MLLVNKRGEREWLKGIRFRWEQVDCGLWIWGVDGWETAETALTQQMLMGVRKVELQKTELRLSSHPDSGPHTAFTNTPNRGSQRPNTSLEIVWTSGIIELLLLIGRVRLHAILSASKITCLLNHAEYIGKVEALQATLLSERREES
jgi:hypothetical protein